jgi:hypothetical protein
MSKVIIYYADLNILKGHFFRYPTEANGKKRYYDEELTELLRGLKKDCFEFIRFEIHEKSIQVYRDSILIREIFPYVSAEVIGYFEQSYWIRHPIMYGGGPYGMIFGIIDTRDFVKALIEEFYENA